MTFDLAKSAFISQWRLDLPLASGKVPAPHEAALAGASVVTSRAASLLLPLASAPPHLIFSSFIFVALCTRTSKQGGQWTIPLTLFFALISSSHKTKRHLILPLLTLIQALRTFLFDTRASLHFLTLWSGALLLISLSSLRHHPPPPLS